MARVDEIKSFTTIVDLGTFSAAAEHLHLTTAGVSRRIKSLEERLGVTLLQRTTRSASLTEAGEFYNQRVREVMDTMTALEKEIQNLTDHPSGKIKVNAPPAFTEKVLANLLHRFSDHYPEIKLEINTTDSHVNLEKDQYDIAFRLSKSALPNYVHHSVGRITFNIVASPDYIAQQPPITSLNDIQSHNCLQFTDQAQSGKWQFANGTQTQAVPINGNLITNCANVLLKAAINGQGLAYVPDFIYREHIENGDLQLVLPQHASPSKHLYAIHNDQILGNKKVNLLIDFIRQQLAPQNTH